LSKTGYTTFDNRSSTRVHQKRHHYMTATAGHLRYRGYRSSSCPRSRPFIEVSYLLITAAA